MAKLKTGRHTSALKEARKAEKRTARNAAMKSKKCSNEKQNKNIIQES